MHASSSKPMISSVVRSVVICSFFVTSRIFRINQFSSVTISCFFPYDHFPNLHISILLSKIRLHNLHTPRYETSPKIDTIDVLCKIGAAHLRFYSAEFLRRYHLKHFRYFPIVQRMIQFLENIAVFQIHLVF